MKANFIIAFLLFSLIVFSGARVAGQNLATNTFSLDQNDIWDEIGDEHWAYGRWILHGVVMPETLPASEDTNDIWGVETNGFQLSLRIPGGQYFAEGTVPVIAILRNLKSSPQTLLVTNSRSLFFDFMVYSGTNRCLPKPEKPEPHKKPSLEEIDRPSSIFAPPAGYSELVWGARSERISEFKLNHFFDSSLPGDYSVRAICRVYSSTNKVPLYEISSGTASFRLLAKPNPQK